MPAASTEDLTTIRRLSQYRPFERGGASAREAQDDLVLAVLAEGDGCETVAQCRESVATLFRIDLDDMEVARALEVLVREGRVVRERGFRLAAAERDRLETAARESRRIQDEALNDFRADLQERWPNLTGPDIASLERDLEVYLRAVLRRHGAEAALVLYPEEEAAQDLFADLEQHITEVLEPVRDELEPVREVALSSFLRTPTAAQKLYLSQNLNTAYFLTVLSIDAEGARLVRDVARGQRVYLDTNFIYRLLGIQGPRYVKPAETLLGRTRDAGYECCVTRWTITELQTSLARSRDYLERHPVPPTEFATLAADATSESDFVTAYWRRVRDQPGLKASDFVQLYAEIEPHLEPHGIQIINEGCTAVDQRPDVIAREVGLLEQVLHGRPRGLERLEHDVRHRLLVRRLRGEANRNFSNFGYIFLTHDSVLPRYDFYSRGRRSTEVPFCISAGAWFQIVEAFRPKSEDPDQSLADMLASPYVRYRRVLSKETAQRVAARLSLYEGGTPDLAARVFMNTAALADIEVASTPEEQTEQIDNAIVQAAQQAQLDADAARQQLEEERRRAQVAAEEGEARLRDAERRREEEVRREQAEAREALKQEEFRSEQRLAAERECQRVELERRDRELAETKAAREAEKRRSTRLGRRLRLLVFALVAFALFVVIALVADVSAAWAFIVAAGVLVGLLAAVDQFLNRREGG